MFKISLSVDDLRTYLTRQLSNFFPDDGLYTQDVKFSRSLRQALDRSEYCFRHVALKAYHNEGNTFFSHLHSDQYTLFLWFLSNSVWKEFEDNELATKLFYLNKTLNNVLCMYDADMPDIFLVIHGGVVLGKASYNDFFVCYQGCTVGAINGIYPKLGKGVAMAPQSTIVGNCIVEDNATIGNQAILRNANLSSGMIYYRDIDTGKHMTQKMRELPWAQSFFNVPILRNGEN